MTSYPLVRRNIKKRAMMPTKHCNGCNQDRDAEDFKVKDKTKGTRQALCRFCIAGYGREHYKNNKQAYIAKAKSRNTRISEENRTKLFAYLAQHPCVDCGETDVRCANCHRIRESEKGGSWRCFLGF